jgi:hypothetical protein
VLLFGDSEVNLVLNEKRQHFPRINLLRIILVRIKVSKVEKFDALTLPLKVLNLRV